MTYRLRTVALRQIEAYLREYSEDFALEQIERLDHILRFNLAKLH